MTLHWNALEAVRCGDGSTAGFWASPQGEGTRRDIVVVFTGGGSCLDQEECDDTRKRLPHSLSSDFFPQTIEGSTFLSDNASINPDMFEYDKVVVGYCSQDMFLGNGNATLGKYERQGSLHLQAVFRYIETMYDSNSVDQMVVVGISAGSMGVVNHLSFVRQAARSLNVQSLRFVLDSPTFSSFAERKYSDQLAATIDFQLHPLCDWKNGPQIQNELSTLACCMSINCMLEQGIFKNKTFDDEAILVMDSTYDTLEAFESLQGSFEELSISTTRDVSDRIWFLGENSGSRQNVIAHTVFDALSTENLIWVTPSCLTHTFLFTSFQLHLLACQHGDFRGEDVKIKCKHNASAQSISTNQGLTFDLWLTDDTWERASVHGYSIKNLLGQFVSNNTLEGFPTRRPLLLADDCFGPNCVAKGSSEANACQVLFEVSNNFKSVHTAQLVSLLFYVVLLAITGVLIRYRITGKVISRANRTFTVLAQRIFPVKSRELPPSRFRTRGVKLEPTTVSSSLGNILEDVCLELKPGTVSCLMGRTGSGKTTLLGVLSGQLQSGLVVSTKSDIDFDSTAYLRQHDMVMMGNMSPFAFLDACADVYGASKTALREICQFVEPFFPCRSPEAGNTVDKIIEPFRSTKIAKCSGGQRRVLAIASAFLTNPSVILLDEPLSGLDSVAGERLMQFLNAVAMHQHRTVLLTLHQPSDAILNLVDHVLIMKEGRKVFDESREVVQCAVDRCKATREDSELTCWSFLHSVLKDGIVEESHFEALYQAGQEAQIREKVQEDVSLASQTNTIPTKGAHCQPFSQTLSIGRRLRLEFGNNFHDLLVLPFCFVVMSLILRLRGESPIQVFLASLFFLFIPVIIFQHHLLLGIVMWRAHRWELDDRRISCASYQLATSTFSISVPLVSLFVSLLVAYTILGWSFNTFLIQYAFGSLFLLVIIWFGRNLSLLASSEYMFWKVYHILIFFNVALSGTLASPNDAPQGLRWIFYLSFTFWGTAGVVLNQYDTNDHLGEHPCLSFTSCVLSDGNVLAEAVGYPPIVTSFVAFQVLLTAYFVLYISEYFLLRRRRAHIVQPHSKLEKSDRAKLFATNKESGGSARNDGSHHELPDPSGLTSQSSLAA